MQLPLTNFTLNSATADSFYFVNELLNAVSLMLNKKQLCWETFLMAMHICCAVNHQPFCITLINES